MSCLIGLTKQTFTISHLSARGHLSNIGAPGVVFGGGLSGVEKLSNEGTWLVATVWLEGAGVDNIPSTIAVAILSAAAAASEAPTITEYQFYLVDIGLIVL